MTPEERDLISGLFDRLKQFESQQRDPEVERLIANLVARQPAAPYLLAQTVLVQEQALKGAQARIAELEAKGGGAAPSSGFLSSAPKIGPWGASPSSAVTRAGAAPPPPTQSWGGAAPAAGGGFLRTALMTAAGVAGGALLFEGIRNMMGHSPGPFAAAQPLPPSASDLPADQQVLEGSDGGDDSSLDTNDSGFDSGGSDDSSF